MNSSKHHLLAAVLGPVDINIKISVVKPLMRLRCILSKRGTLLLVAALGAGGSTIAPAHAQTISACVANGDGAVRIATTCRRGETLITWNQAGPQGPQGPQGIQGIPGTTGQQVFSFQAQEPVRFFTQSGIIQTLDLPATGTNSFVVVTVTATANNDSFSGQDCILTQQLMRNGLGQSVTPNMLIPRYDGSFNSLAKQTSFTHVFQGLNEPQSITWHWHLDNPSCATGGIFVATRAIHAIVLNR